MISVAVAKWSRIGIGRRRVVKTAALETTERRQRALLSAELHHGSIRAERLCTMAEVLDLTIRIRKRRITNSAGAKVFLSERLGGGSGQRDGGDCEQATFLLIDLCRIRGAVGNGARPAAIEPLALSDCGGAAWGRAFRYLVADDEPIEVEGDKRTPAGIYAIDLWTRLHTRPRGCDGSLLRSRRKDT